ncbi:MarR family winged helix-turn-helix transcriptional regulator [Bordetella sp. 2513F-2]
MSTKTMLTPDVMVDDLRLRFLRIAHTLRREERDLPLTEAQCAVLRWLMLEPLRVSDLARAESVSLPTMTQMVGRMIDIGLVQRESPAGSYNNFLTITDAGRCMVKAVAATRNKSLKQRLALLDEGELRALADIIPVLDKMYDRTPWR